MITIAQIEEWAVLPADQWAGRCAEIAEIARIFGRRGRHTRGHWRGPIAPGSHFASRAHIGFVQHSWLTLPDGRVLDPTRFVFEGVAPYVYHGASDYYDEGGNVYRMEELGPPPEPVDERTTNLVLDDATGEIVAYVLDDPLAAQGALTFAQARWLAHLDPVVLDMAARPVFAALIDARLGALIPFDNKHRVMDGAWLA